MDDYGAGFWLKAFGVIVALAIGGIILMWLLGAAWYAFGALGALLFAFVLVAAVAWMVDRSRARRYDDVGA